MRNDWSGSSLSDSRDGPAVGPHSGWEVSVLDAEQPVPRWGDNYTRFVNIDSRGNVERFDDDAALGHEGGFPFS